MIREGEDTPTLFNYGYCVFVMAGKGSLLKSHKPRSRGRRTIIKESLIAFLPCVTMDVSQAPIFPSSAIGVNWCSAWKTLFQPPTSHQVALRRRRIVNIDSEKRAYTFLFLHPFWLRSANSKFPDIRTCSPTISAFWHIAVRWQFVIVIQREWWCSTPASDNSKLFLSYWSRKQLWLLSV